METFKFKNDVFQIETKEKDIVAIIKDASLKLQIRTFFLDGSQLETSIYILRVALAVEEYHGKVNWQKFYEYFGQKNRQSLYQPAIEALEYIKNQPDYEIICRHLEKMK